jgi:hypothetical protein
MERSVDPTTRATRWLYGLAAALLVFYALNVALRIAAVKFGAAPWRLGDVGEFLLVLAGMACFVAGLMVDEERQTAPVRPEVGSNPKQGGTQ